MKRRLLFVNLVLLALVILAGRELRERWKDARAREQRVLRQQLTGVPVPAVAPIPQPQPAKPGDYVSVAQQMPFVRDRNPNVILDPPPPPPPPKPMPETPTVHGVVDFGSGPTVIMSEKAGAPHKGYRLGEMVGQFKLLSVNNDEILFQWEGKPVRRKLEELLARNPEPPENEQPAPVPAPAEGQPSVSTIAPGKPKPGTEMKGQTRACEPGDPTPAGTVVDGMRKVVARTPFGESCRWEPVK